MNSPIFAENSMMAENKKLKQLMVDLNTSDQSKIARSIKLLETHGDSSVIKPLADKLLGDLSKANRKSILELFSSFKDTSVCVEVMDVLQDEQYKSVRQEILSTIWNTKVDFSDYIDDFVEIAVNGDFMETLDCLTIIENLEGPFMEENILESQLHLKKYLEQTDNKDDQKARLLSEIAIAIKDINQKLMD